MIGLLAGAALAHTLAPARLTLEETAAGWRMTQRLPRAALGVLDATPPCDAAAPAVEIQAQHAEITHTLRCAEAPSVLDVTGIAESGSPLLVEVRRDGRVGRTLRTEDGAAALPAPQGRLHHAGRYLREGIAHVLTGLDHVLVILALAMVAGRRWALAVTGFTVGHSLTLVVCALGLLQIPAAVTEGLIALSLIVLGDQLLRARPHAWGMAALIGLLHGMGFGSGLAGLGLPMEATGLALGAFNLGVEVGQLFVVLVALRWARWERARPLLAGSLAAAGVFFLLQALA